MRELSLTLAVLRVRAALEKVLGEVVEAGALTEAQAYSAGERILNRNIREVYWG